MSKGNYILPFHTNDSEPIIGEALPVLHYTISIAEVFMFSAITWNRHSIHYDKEQAIKEGHAGVLIQRGLIGNILCRYIADIMPEPVIEKLNWRVLASTLAGSTLSASGMIGESRKMANGRKLILNLLLSNGNMHVCRASAEVHETVDGPIYIPAISTFKN